MPRITNFTFTKDYHLVADGLATMLENAVISPEYEHEGKPAIDVEGDFSTLSLEAMDAWKGHIKFVVWDNSFVDSDEVAAKGSLAIALPEFAQTLFSPTIAKVYKRIEYIIRTTTIVERIEDGEQKTRDEKVEASEVQYEWKDVTLELGRIFEERAR